MQKTSLMNTAKYVEQSLSALSSACLAIAPIKKVKIQKKKKTRDHVLHIFCQYASILK